MKRNLISPGRDLASPSGWARLLSGLLTSIMLRTVRWMYMDFTKIVLKFLANWLFGEVNLSAFPRRWRVPVYILGIIGNMVFWTAVITIIDPSPTSPNPLGLVVGAILCYAAAIWLIRIRERGFPNLFLLIPEEFREQLLEVRRRFVEVIFRR